MGLTSWFCAHQGHWQPQKKGRPTPRAKARWGSLGGHSGILVLVFIVSLGSLLRVCVVPLQRTHSLLVRTGLICQHGWPRPWLRWGPQPRNPRPHVLVHRLAHEQARSFAPPTRPPHPGKPGCSALGQPLRLDVAPGTVWWVGPLFRSTNDILPVDTLGFRCLPGSRGVPQVK